LEALLSWIPDIGHARCSEHQPYVAEECELVAWFRRLWRGGGGGPEPSEQQTGELLDQYHRRASIADGGQMIIAPGKVLDNIAHAMERVDVDIATPISIEEDVATVNELLTLVDNLKLGPTLAVHTVNTALKIMAARYPDDLVRTPLPPEYDLRNVSPIEIDDRVHDIAKTIFNLRSSREEDLSEDDVSATLRSLDVPDQMTVFVALFYMFGTKVGALKNRTGIE